MNVGSTTKSFFFTEDALQKLERHRRQTAVSHIEEDEKWRRASQALLLPQANQGREHPKTQPSQSTSNAQIALPPVPDREAEFTGAANKSYASASPR